jgi:hypothetical protein
MRSKHFLLIALCAVLLTAVSCKTKSSVKSFVVDPELGSYSYAASGDTLEFKALNPNSPPFFVIFENPSPCAETFVKVTKDTPGTCKVRKASGTFRYAVSKLPPSPDIQPRSCPQCQIFIVPTPIPPSGVPPQPPNPSSSSSLDTNGKG